MPIFAEHQGERVPIRIWTDDIDPAALAQLRAVAALPIVAGHVAAMPDVHVGIGATVGAVIPTRRAIIPAAVGVDIGCGMCAVRTSLAARDLPDKLSRLRGAIEAAVPVGFDQHPEEAAPGRRELGDLAPRLRAIRGRHPRLEKMVKDLSSTWRRQLGTLGGGNHFIEICLDEEERVWVMLHSGSRGIGNAIGRYFIGRAREEFERRGAGTEFERLPHKDLAYFTADTPLYDDYVEAVGWAQDYAHANRALMLALVLDAIAPELPPFALDGAVINCHHNYVAAEEHGGERLLVTRKGAIRAGAGELGIVPGSMGARSYVVRGKGNPLSFCSCAHGAGRRLSREQAKRRFSRADLLQQTAGVECRKDAGVLDEIPAAYKDIDRVMANQSDLVEVVHTLKQVVCVKG
jgi:tRNA-splicing ligase RtcB